MQVIVSDENDNHPVFQNHSFTVKVAENAPVGKRIIQLSASDMDEGRSGRVVYSLVNSAQQDFSQRHSSATFPASGFGIKDSSQPSMGSFKIDASSGWLILNQPLDYERTKTHLVRVYAKDEAGHPGFDEATVHILVTDVNDVAPVITVDTVAIDQSSRSKEIFDQQWKNVLDLYVNETENWNPSTRNAESQHISQASQLIAFVVVSDPDTEQGGMFECNLVASELDRSNNLNSPSYEPSTFNPTPPEILKSPSVISRFQLSPISRTQFELTNNGGFDHETKDLEKFAVSTFNQNTICRRL